MEIGSITVRQTETTVKTVGRAFLEGVLSGYASAVGYGLGNLFIAAIIAAKFDLPSSEVYHIWESIMSDYEFALNVIFGFILGVTNFAISEIIDEVGKSFTYWETISLKALAYFDTPLINSAILEMGNKLNNIGAGSVPDALYATSVSMVWNVISSIPDYNSLAEWFEMNSIKAKALNKILAVGFTTFANTMGTIYSKLPMVADMQKSPE